MNVLVTGAAGTVGTETLEQLLKIDNIKVTAFDLPSKKIMKKLNKYKDKANIFYGQITDYQTVEQICKNQNIVIHLAAVIPPLADEKPQLAYNVNVIGTQNIVKALEKGSPKAFLIYSSSISVYGDRIKNPNIKVTDKLQASEGDEYAKTKINAEKIIRSSTLQWVIFRLTAIFGVKNHKLNKLMFHMPLDTKMEIATAEDTARALTNAIFHTNELKGKIFNLGGGEKCRTTYKEFLKKNFEIYGFGKMRLANKYFATQNFHCGFYDDGDELEKILHFRKDTLDDYYTKLKKSIPPTRRFLTRLFSHVIQAYLVSTSEPFKALKHKNKSLIKRFFGEKKLHQFIK